MYCITRAIWSILLFFFLGSTLCFADTLVITFRSGKTQEVVLEDSAGAVEGIQFKSSQKDAVKPSQPQKTEENSQKTEQIEKHEKMPEPASSKDEKQGIRLKWAEPKPGD